MKVTGNNWKDCSRTDVWLRVRSQYVDGIGRVKMRDDMMWKKALCGSLMALGITLASAITGLAEETTFVSGTAVNGLGISNMTVEEAKEHIGNFYASEYELKIVGRGGTFEVIHGSDIGFQVTLPEGFLQEILNSQNAAGRVFGPDVDNRYKVDMKSTYSEDALSEKIAGLQCISGAGSRPTEDARISDYQQGRYFTVVPEVYGNSADIGMIEALVRNSVAEGLTELKLEETGCYQNPKLTSRDEGLQAACRLLNQRRPMEITYTFGEAEDAVTAVLDWGTIASWCVGVQDGQLVLNRDKAAAYVKSLAESYDTANKERTFVTATGREVVLNGPYGWRIDQNAETDALIALVQGGESQQRTPVYAASAASRTAPDWGKTYAEVDLTGQHVYMIQDGTVVWDAPCVTGNVSRGWGTPSGIYSISYKDRDAVLRGEKRADGSYSYESPVKYWMPFNRGIGFHDANWRGSFGGGIYQTNGSHGCINLPPHLAQGLFDRVYKGMPVLCYE